jgi:hypothetical protein
MFGMLSVLKHIDIFYINEVFPYIIPIMYPIAKPYWSVTQERYVAVCLPKSKVEWYVNCGPSQQLPWPLADIFVNSRTLCTYGRSRVAVIFSREHGVLRRL